MNLERKFYLTKEGFEGIKKEYEILKNLRLAKTKGEVPSIWESEDLNPEYLSFREDLTLLERRMIELENILKNAVLIKKPLKKERNIVKIGAKILVEIDRETEDNFEIVGTVEANPSLGRISNESPVGKALLGRKAGDEIIVSSPIKTVYKIKKINYD